MPEIVPEEVDATDAPDTAGGGISMDLHGTTSIVTDRASTEALTARTLERFGTLDAVINLARGSGARRRGRLRGRLPAAAQRQLKPGSRVAPAD